MSLIILDRDGVINHDSDEFIKSLTEWEPIAGSLEAIAHLNHAGYRVVVMTNQSAIARGLLDVSTLANIHSKMRRMLAQVGGTIEAILYCPHGADDKCVCRKPKAGMYNELADRLRINLQHAIAIGDSLRDVEAAQAVGATPILVKTGKGEAEAANLPDGVAVYDNLAAAASALIASGT